MKNLIVPIIAFMALISSCAKDKGNYDYNPKEEVEVKGIATSYTVISEKENLVINPEVTSTDPSAQLEYLWGIYETNVQGYAPKLDTLAKTKNLNYAVKQAAKGWVLVYRVTNKKTGYAQHFKSDINVVTEFTRGWYVAKDDGSQADLDLFLTPTNIIPNGKRENIYSTINGAKAPGKVNMLSFLSSYKSNVTGVNGNTRTLFLVTDKDIAATYVNTLRKIKDFNSIFIGTPSVKSPSALFVSGTAYYLVNDGQVHSIYNMGSNFGQFSARIMKDANNTNYNLSKYFLPGIPGLVDPYLFDEITSSFVSMSQGSGPMAVVGDDATTTLPASNNNQKLLYMGTKSMGYPAAPGIVGTLGYAIFQDKTNPAIKNLAEISGYSGFKLKIIQTPLTVADKLYNATMHTLLFGDESMMYFVVGNEIWSRNLANKFEKLEFTLPAGEELTFMRHKKATETGYAYNYVMIGSKVGANYKVRMFSKSSGSLNATPDFTLEGTGIAREAIYISPAASESTHNPSF
ncbi:MAG: PKD-like family lipoprotein [Pedobacter sp.]|uniref:PKD-like family lipoprotein n=1 Tax=Pedobacter sp. TaxID=1411316 RepID=UPI0028080D71|nr:PKD-like family lipoprotein [Pedobacter sp.]MDQ8005175.1 PKD-like family lipoprotein [Pedobacter sp.]